MSFVKRKRVRGRISERATATSAIPIPIATAICSQGIGERYDKSHIFLTSPWTSRPDVNAKTPKMVTRIVLDSSMVMIYSFIGNIEIRVYYTVGGFHFLKNELMKTQIIIIIIIRKIILIIRS